jgi:replicative DNA helicase
MNKEQFNKFLDNYSILGQRDDFINHALKLMNTPRINTGWNKFDDKLNGGLMPGLYCLGAISSLGKTAFSLQLANYLAKQDRYVLYFTIEMSRHEMIARSISQTAFQKDPVANKDIGTLEVLTGLKSEKILKDYSSDYFNSHQNISFIEGSFNMTVPKIKNIIKDYKEITNHRPIVFIDYLQLLNHGEKDSKGNDRYLNEKQTIDSVTKSLKQTSRDLQVPMWVISSFNRQSYKSPVSYECFKESGVIEYTSDVLMGLQLSVLDYNLPSGKDSQQKVNAMINDAKAQDIKEITLVVLKQRNGKSFIKQKFKFHAKNNFFVEV